MRLSAEVLSLSEQRSNAVGEREIVLRGLAIPAIEHLAVTRDQFDAIDLADNRVTRLENFPRMLRLSSLFISGNFIETVDAINLATNVPNLSNLVLTDNRIRCFREVANIATGCPKLEFLTLVGNPVMRRQHYRLYTISKIPSLKVLDFIKVKEKERCRSKCLAPSVVGTALEGDLRIESRDSSMTGVKTFTTGECPSMRESFLTNFTKQQQLYIKAMIANSSSLVEIERIETMVKRGEFPGTSDLLPQSN